MNKTQNVERPILIEGFNMGGISDSKFSGIKNSLYKLIGWDMHSTPALLKTAQKMTKNSGSTVTEFCKCRVASTNGCTYWGSSSSGKIWERASDGTWTLVITITAAAGGVNILGMFEYQGYIYIATESRLHRIASTHTGSTAWGANIALNWATFTKTDALYHPMTEQNLVLFIGDGNQVAQVDGSTFSANAMDIGTPLRIKTLGKIGTDLLIGTWVSDNITKTRVFRWNTWSVSFTSSDEIDEVGINAFLEADNIVYINAGLQGNIYVYDGEKLELFRKISGDYSPTATALVNPNAVANLGGQILFGVSNGTGNPCDQGVYRIGRHSRNYPYIMDLPYPISQRNSTEFVLTNLEIGAVLVVGSNILVSWKDSTGTPAYGVDILDYSNKLDGAYFETRIMSIDREIFTNFTKFLVAYASLPSSTAINISYSKNYASYVATTEKSDPDRLIVYSEAEGVEANVLQMKVAITASSNTAPEIESAAVFIK